MDPLYSIRILAVDYFRFVRVHAFDGKLTGSSNVTAIKPVWGLQCVIAGWKHFGVENADKNRADRKSRPSPRPIRIRMDYKLPKCIHLFSMARWDELLKSKNCLNC